MSVHPLHTTASAREIDADRSPRPRVGRWAARLRQLSREAQSPETEGLLWQMLNTALAEYLRQQAARMQHVSREDIEDIASKKALDLVHRIVVGKWDVLHRSPEEIASFVSTTAKHELLNLTRRAKRRVLPRDEDRPEWDVGRTGEGQTMSMMEAPDALVERREFAFALRDCAAQLKPRSRAVWFLRVFCDMSSKRIAAHPAVSLKVGHVDVVLQRCRKAMRECMGKKGFLSQDMPPGAFVELWKAIWRERAAGPLKDDV